MGKFECYGLFSVTLDDKSRVMLPAKIRTTLHGDSLIMTKGVDSCLNLYLPEDWESIRQMILTRTSEYSTDGRALRRRMTDSAEQITIDSVGRVKIPLPLMRNVGIRKSVSCLLLARNFFMELWSEDVFKIYEEENASGIQKIWEDIGKHWEGE